MASVHVQRWPRLRARAGQIILFCLAAVLGAAACVATGEISSVATSYDKSLYGLQPDVYQYLIGEHGSVSPEAVVELKARLIHDVEHQSVSIILDARGDDGPRVGIYDPGHQLTQLKTVQGRMLTRQEYRSEEPAVVVNTQSYIAETLHNGSSPFLPAATTVIGDYRDVSATFTADYLYNLFSTDTFIGQLTLGAATPSIAEQLVSELGQAGYQIQQRPVLSRLQYIQSTKGALEFTGILLLVALSGMLIVIDVSLSQRGRWRIAKMFGATAVSITRREAPLSALTIGSGLASGVVLAAGVASLLAPALVPSVELLIALVLGGAAISLVLIGVVTLIVARSVKVIA